jgi:hypothetical protein
MKNLFKISILAVLFSLTACDQNDDVANPTDGFTNNGTFYETPNCYIEFDEDLPPNEFNLFFLNGRMLDNVNHIASGSTNDYLFTLNSSNFVFYNIRDVENPSILIPSYPNIQTGVTYTGGNSDTVIIANGQISPLGYTTSGYAWGEGVDGVGLIAQGGTIVINSYNYDATTQTGTINVDYQSLNNTGQPIIGHYEGSLGVILD